MKTYTVTFTSGEKVEQKADWFVLSSEFGNGIARFYRQRAGLRDEELIAAYVNVSSVILKPE